MNSGMKDARDTLRGYGFDEDEVEAFVYRLLEARFAYVAPNFFQNSGDPMSVDAITQDAHKYHANDKE